MKQLFLLLIILLAFTISSCGDTDVETTPEEPQPTRDYVYVESQVKEAVKGNEVLGLEVGEVACDEANNKLTFTFANTGIYVWNLDGNAPLVSTEEKNVKIFINQYEANRKAVQFHPETGERMFGPSRIFSENCGGVSTMAPGDTATCTLMPVKLIRESGSQGLKAINQIFINGLSADTQMEFTC